MKSSLLSICPSSSCRIERDILAGVWGTSYFGVLGTSTIGGDSYEAGREGFSLHRYLNASGIDNAVVDAGSLEVKRRRRRAKTDRLDLGTLMNRLIRWHRGERGVWSVVRLPSVEEEDQRQWHRELSALKKERTRHVNRLKGLLACQGVRMKVGSDFLARLSEVRLWDGSRLPATLHGLGAPVLGEVVEDPADDRWIEEEGEEPHLGAAVRAGQGIDFVVGRYEGSGSIDSASCFSCTDL